MSILRNLPRKHLIWLAVVDLALTFANFLLLPLIGGILDQAVGGFSTSVKALALAFYCLYFFFSLFVSTWVVAMFYAVLRFFGVISSD